MSYWEEYVSAALDSAGVDVSKEQLTSIIDDVEAGHEMYGMAHGHECIPNPLENEVRELRGQLKVEKSTTACTACHGKGYLRFYVGTYMTESQCGDN